MYMSLFLLKILIIFHCVGHTEALFNGALKKLKQKAKNAYNKKFGKDKTWHFLGHDLTEYPGTNAKYRAINKEKWDDYYACLTALDDSMANQAITPEAIQGIEASSIRYLIPRVK